MRSAHAARSSAKTGQEMRSCGGRLSRWVRIATVPWAKAQRRPNSKRARRSSAHQWAPRSRSTASSAAANCRPGSRRAARCGPCRDGCGRRPAPARPARRPGGGWLQQRRQPARPTSAPAGVDSGDPPLGDLDVDQRQPLARVREAALQQTERHPGVGDPQPLHCAPSLAERSRHHGASAVIRAHRDRVPNDSRRADEPAMLASAPGPPPDRAAPR